MALDYMNPIHSLLKRRIAHPWRWIGISVVIFLLPTLSLLLLSNRGRTTSKPIEEVLWTSDLSHTVFYGPGTPQSLTLASRLKEATRVPTLSYDGPVYIAPLNDPNSKSDDITIISPFDPSAAQLVMKDHQQSLKSVRLKN